MDSCSLRIRQIADSSKALAGPLLPILHGVQDHFGYLPPATTEQVADVLNLSRAEVHGVISFYHLFRTTPPGRRTLFLCQAEACQANGSEALSTYVRKRLGIEWHETTADGRISLEPVYCLGNCACGPALMVDTRLVGRVTRARIDELLDE